MSLRLTFYQIQISPKHVTDGVNRELEDDDPDRIDPTRTLECVDGATIYPMGWDHNSAGNPAAGTGVLNLLVAETVQDERKR